MILAFHGSPGLPEDFSSLKQELERLEGASSLYAVIRKGYPGSRNQVFQRKAGTQYLGYSFGCADAVEAASNDPQAKSVILLAPYLFPTKETGLALKTILALPMVSDLLLFMLGSRAMRGFAVKTAFPAQPSEGYLRSTQSYAKPSILRRAMTETSGRAPRIRQALESLSKRHVPVFLIWGKEDQVSTESQQIDPLRALFPQMKEITLNAAGHALPWTHVHGIERELVKGENR